MRPDGACAFDLLLNDGPPRLAARSSFDNTGDVGTGAAVVDEGAVAQTWSAKCKMSMSTEQDEHLMVGRRLIRSMLSVEYQPGWPSQSSVGRARVNNRSVVHVQRLMVRRS